MPIQGKCEKILRELGLTQSQARVYLSIIKLGGQSTVKTLSDFAGIARQDVYRVTAELQQLSLIETVIGNPSVFKAVPIQEVIPMLAERREKHTYELLTEAQEVLHKLSETIAETPADQTNSHFVLIPKKEVIIRRTEKIISKLQKKMQLITPWREHTQWLFRQATQINQALARGVNIQVITEQPNDSETYPEGLRAVLTKPNFQVRTAQNPHQTKFIIFDSKDVFVATQIQPNAGESPALWTNSPTVIHILEDYFEMKWNISEKYASNVEIKRDNSARDAANIKNPA